MQKTHCRWGILGTAEIARKNWQAIRNATNCTLTAVASRDIERCRSFINDCQRQVSFDPPPLAFGSYEELLASDAVDAVYLPLPTAIRKLWVIRAAKAGKHVLAEKPVGGTAQDVQDILAVCQQSDVQFMDGVMFMHSRRMESIRKAIADPQCIGALKRITSAFSFGAGNDFFAINIRTRGSLEPLGCLGDLGWYNIRFTLWAMNWELPTRVAGHLLSEHGPSDGSASVPTEFAAELFFANGVSASFYCSFLTEIQQWVNLAGTRGSIHVPDFVLPRYGAETIFDVSNPVYNITGCDFNMEEHVRRCAIHEYSNSDKNAQETNMFHRFGELVLSGQRDSTWGEMALKTQQVLDACLRSARSGGGILDLPG
jgi:predicted dehydrogenase